MSIIISFSVGESIICGAWSLHEVLEETHAEVSHACLRAESKPPRHSVSRNNILLFTECRIYSIAVLLGCIKLYSWRVYVSQQEKLRFY